MLRRNLARQKAALPLGFVPWRGQPCQKQPSTNTMSRLNLKTQSGRTRNDSPFASRPRKAPAAAASLTSPRPSARPPRRLRCWRCLGHTPWPSGRGAGRGCKCPPCRIMDMKQPGPPGPGCSATPPKKEGRHPCRPSCYEADLLSLRRRFEPGGGPYQPLP